MLWRVPIMASPICHASPAVRSWLLWHLLKGRYLQLSVCSYSHSTASVQQHYSVLQVSSDCDEGQLKEAFVSLAKQYHPDSGHENADASKFTEVEEAYRSLCKHRRAAIEAEKAEEEIQQVIFDIKHTAPQHRQYLSFDGKGYGSPSQRQRQYQQYKFAKAYENVYEYRIQQVSAKYEDAMVLKDKRAARKTAIKNTLHRIAEDLISEMVARGEFDNLQGKGRPLKYREYNPMVDSMTHNLNKILIQNGYAPEWIILDREIRQMIEVGRKSLMSQRIKAGPEPLSPGAKREWDYAVLVFKDTIEQINKKITDYNILVPSLRQQRMTYNMHKEIQKVLHTYRDMLKNGEIPDCKTIQNAQASSLQASVTGSEVGQLKGQFASLRDVWKEVKSLFTSKSS